MNGFDVTVLIICIFFTLLGVYWGLIRQVLSLAGLLVGLVVAGRFGGDVAGWLSSFIDNPTLAGALGFILVLLLVSVVASLIAALLRFFVGLLFLGWLDHLLGGVLGFIQAVIVSAVLVVVAVTFSLPAFDQAIADSRFAGVLLNIGGVLALLLPEAFRAAVQAALGR